MVHLSHPYMTTGKTIALTRWTFVGKVMSLPYNMLSRLVIAFLPSKHFLISWLQSPSAVILEPPPKKKINSDTVSTLSLHDALPIYSQESSPTPQFKSINSSPLSFLYSPTLTSIHAQGMEDKGKTEELSQTGRN